MLRIARGDKCQKKRTSNIFPLKPVAPEKPYPKPVQMAASVESRARADIQEAIDHVKLLQQVLLPYVNGKTDGLAKGERRAVMYLLSEVSALLQKLNTK